MSTCCRSSILTLTLSSWVSLSRCQSQHSCLDCHCHLQDSLTVFLLSLDVILGYQGTCQEEQLSLLSCVRNAWPWRTHLSLFWRLEWSQPHSGCCCDQEHFVPLRSKNPMQWYILQNQTNRWEAPLLGDWAGSSSVLFSLSGSSRSSTYATGSD